MRSVNKRVEVVSSGVEALGWRDRGLAACTQPQNASLVQSCHCVYATFVDGPDILYCQPGVENLFDEVAKVRVAVSALLQVRFR